MFLWNPWFFCSGIGQYQGFGPRSFSFHFSHFILRGNLHFPRLCSHRLPVYWASPTHLSTFANPHSSIWTICLLCWSHRMEITVIFCLDSILHLMLLESRVLILLFACPVFNTEPGMSLCYVFRGQGCLSTCVMTPLSHVRSIVNQLNWLVRRTPPPLHISKFCMKFVYTFLSFPHSRPGHNQIRIVGFGTLQNYFPL